MSQRSEAERPATEEDLSALMDGELDASAVVAACHVWRDSAQVRGQWHAYHLIGDVMRSEDLVSSPQRDERFLVQFRERMAGEPVVLAPAGSASQDAVTPVRTRRSWMAPAAVAAGFAAVTGVLVVTQLAGGLSLREPTGGATLARQGSGALQTASMGEGAASGPGDAAGTVLSGQLVRDARLDEYLSAHKKFGGSSLPGGPSGFLRSASVDAPAR